MKKKELQNQVSFNDQSEIITQNNNIRYLTHSYYKKYEQRKNLELLIWLSFISFIGMLWIWILALYWLISFRNAEKKFMVSWKENKSFRAIFPYQPEFHDLITEDTIYQYKLEINNRRKTLFMVLLAIPFLGHAFLFTLSLIISIITFGIVPFLFYYYLNGSKRHINTQIEKMYQDFLNVPQIKGILAHYNRSGYLSFNFAIAEKIMRALNFTESEIILGIFQNYDPIDRSLLIITDSKVIKYTPGFILDYGENIYIIPKEKIASFNFRKGTVLSTLTIEPSDEKPLVFSSLNKRTIEPLRATLNQLEQVHVTTVSKIPTMHEKKERKIKAVSEPFFCQVCESKRPGTTERLQCDTCSRFVCIDCFNQMVQVGKKGCPMCDGRLISQ